jgi:HEAT repeat protein
MATTMTKRAAPRSLDDQLRAILNAWTYWSSVKEIVALGRPGFERVLDVAERKVSFWDGKGQGRDYEDALLAAVAAFAEQDMGAVLAALHARGWSDPHIALSGVARVSDPRVLPYLLKAYASDEPTTRVYAVDGLGMQHYQRATDALIAALADPSPEVCRAVIRALGMVGDPRAVEPLRAFAKRPAGSKLEADLVQEAITKIRRSKRKR